MIDFTLYIMMLRVLIADLDDTCYEYTDEQLTKIIIVAAKCAYSEVCNLPDATLTYDNALTTLEIDPLPTDQICSLILMKAACLIQNAEVKEKSRAEGVKAVCGPITMQVSSSSGGILSYFLKEGPCATYRDLKRQIEFIGPLCEGNCFRAILTPFVNARINCNSCGTTRSNCGCGG